MIPDHIIARAQKLLNLKEGAEAVGSLAEAENAAAKLSELLMKYNLDMDTVTRHSIEKKSEMFDGWVDLSGKQDKRESFWVPKLYGAIARHNMCRVMIRENDIWILGEARNVELILYICEQMIAKVRIAEKMAWKIHDSNINLMDWQKEKRGTFRRGFFEGACHGIDQKLARQRQEMAEEHNPFAVMIVKKEKEVDDYWQEKYVKPYEQAEEEKRKQRERNEAAGIKVEKAKVPKLRNKRGLSSNVGWRTGYNAGLEMDINKGVDNNKTKGEIK